MNAQEAMPSADVGFLVLISVSNDALIDTEGPVQCPSREEIFRRSI